MKTYNIIVMSIDPDCDPEDNHQKYALQVEAENNEQAIIQGKIMFAEEFGDLPIFWIKIV